MMTVLNIILNLGGAVISAMTGNWSAFGFACCAVLGWTVVWAKENS